jgi:hypothetical protein
MISNVEDVVSSVEERKRGEGGRAETNVGEDVDAEISGWVATPYPAVLNGMVPRPVHIGAVQPTWSPPVARVLVPDPDVTQCIPFHVTPYPAVLNSVFP